MCQNENIHRDISLAALLSFASLLGNLATWTDCNYPALRVCVCVCVCVCVFVSVVRQHKGPLFLPNVGNPVPVTRKHDKNNLLLRLLNITTKEQTCRHTGIRHKFNLCHEITFDFRWSLRMTQWISTELQNGGRADLLVSTEVFSGFKFKEWRKHVSKN